MSGYVAGGASFAQLACPSKESPLPVFGKSRLPSAGKSDFFEQEDFFEQDTSDAVHLNKDCSASSDFASGILSRVMIPFVRCTSTSTAACDDLDPLEYADCEDHWSNSPSRCCNAVDEDWHDASQSTEELCAVEERLTPTAGNEEITYEDGVRGFIVRGAAPSIFALDVKLEDVKHLYTQKFGGEVDTESEEDEEKIIYKDGVRGIVVRGATPSISHLDAKLQEVKNLYIQKFGGLADAESDKDEEIIYKDGVRGIMVRGATPLISASEAKLQEVIHHYSRKIGEEADAESDGDQEEIVYKDGVRGIMVRGAPPSIVALEAKLQDVKDIYGRKFGGDIDAESDEDEEEIIYSDGVRGIMVRGATPSISALEAKLQDVKDLYAQNFGREVDAQSDEDDEQIVYDGVRGIMLRGAAPSISALEAKLPDVKTLYSQKFGEEVDAESDEDEEEIMDKDGVSGIMVRGAPPSIAALEAKLQDAKDIYNRKFGGDVDAESDEDEDEIIYEDGVRGIMVRGAARSISALEAKLQDVKDLFTQNYGREVDAQFDEDKEHIMHDGVRGIMVRGAAPSISALEAKLQDVKTLYSQKFGGEVDAESDEDEEEITCQDGMKGIMLRGAAPSIAALEAKLQDVKDIYSWKFGGDVDAESDEDEEEISYKDGVRGIMVRGAAPSIFALEAKLQDVKTLYSQKFGEEVDAESDEDEEEIRYEDGVRGIMLRGAAPTIAALEAKPQAVQDIYRQKFGGDLDAQSDEDEEEIIYKNGVRGIMVRGATPSIFALEAKLQVVRDIYSQKFGEEVDTESDKRAEEIVYEDGVRGIMARGAAPSISALEAKLQDVKGNYSRKFGRAVDAKSDEDEEIIYKDGVRGIMVRGATPSIFDLEENLQVVKDMYRQKNGEEVDPEFDTDAEEIV